jgi:hypothetical protein
MRDDKIMSLHTSNTRRVMLLLRQVEFLETRIAAYESILSTFRGIAFSILMPSWLRRGVDLKQKELLSDRDKKMREALEKPVIKPVFVNGNG